MRGSVSRSQLEEDNLLIGAHPKIVFLRSLYFLYSVQLLTAFGGVIALQDYQAAITKESQKLSYILGSATAVITMALLAVLFYRQQIQSSPTNFTLYLFFSASFATITNVAINVMDAQFLTIFGSGITLQAVSLCSYVVMSKSELTFQGATLYLFAAFIINSQLFGLFSQIPISTIIWAGAAQIIWGFYLVYDTQSSVPTPYELDDRPINQDPVVGAVAIYSDVFYLILRMIDLLRGTMVKYV